MKPGKGAKIIAAGVLCGALAGCQTSATLEHRDGLLVDHSRPAQGIDNRIRFLVIHYTVEDLPHSLEMLTGENVSTHYVIPDTFNGKKARVWQLAPESARAWHAGVSYWRGRSSLNDTAIGVELVNRGYVKDEQGNVRWFAYPQAQIDTLVTLIRPIVARYQIAPQDIVGHSDIAPLRKQDPGPLFPWEALAKAGLGAWPDPQQVAASLAGRSPNAPVDTARLLDKLHRYGYPVTPNMSEEEQRQVIAAFQMHFRPSDYRGLADAESEAIVDSLLAKYGERT